uniref:ribosomal protein S3 n=1 Tax=Cyathus stercoreus TaxID=181520 RepID=UPI002551D1D7|nr:ribosomal protein S3 [Cyathus stercoreus]WEV87335.1 ribosomal protein S3 [Cyathus stercoreus]
MFNLIKSLKRTNSVTKVKLRELLIKLIRDYKLLLQLTDSTYNKTASATANAQASTKYLKKQQRIRKSRLLKARSTAINRIKIRITGLKRLLKRIQPTAPLILTEKVKMNIRVLTKKLKIKTKSLKNTKFHRSTLNNFKFKSHLSLNFNNSINKINNNNPKVYFNILNNYKVQNLSKFNYSNLRISLIKLKLQLKQLSNRFKAKKQSAIKFSQIFRLHKSKRKIRNYLLKNSLMRLFLLRRETILRTNRRIKKSRKISWKYFWRKVKKLKLTKELIEKKLKTKINYNKLTYRIRKNNKKYMLRRLKRGTFKFHHIAPLNRFNDKRIIFKLKGLNFNLNNYQINPSALKLFQLNKFNFKENKEFNKNIYNNFNNFNLINKQTNFNQSGIIKNLGNFNYNITVSVSHLLFCHYFKYCLDHSNKINFNQFNLIYSKLEYLLKTQINNKFLPFFFKNYLNNIYSKRKIMANEIFLLKYLNNQIEIKKQLIKNQIKTPKLKTVKVASTKSQDRLKKGLSQSLISKFNNSYNRDNSKYLQNLSQLYLNILTPIKDKTQTLLTKSNKQNSKYKYHQFISYNFNKHSNDGNYLSDRMFKNINKLLNAFFKSIYCLISKPTFVITPEKITIKLFYFICLPDLDIIKKSQFYQMFSEKLTVNSNYFKYLYLELGKNLNTFNLINKHERNKFNFSTHNKIKHKILKRFYYLFKNTNHINPKTLNKYGNEFLLAAQENKKDKHKRLYLKKLTLLSQLNIAQSFPKKFSSLTKYLSKLFNKTVEFELTRLYKPNLDSNILASTLNLLLIKKRSYFEFIDSIYEITKLVQLDPYNLAKVKNKKIAVLTGLNIKVAGRLPGQSIIPKVTVKSHNKGISAQGKVNFLDVAKITNKNKMGSFTITISTGQKLI